MKSLMPHSSKKSTKGKAGGITAVGNDNVFSVLHSSVGFWKNRTFAIEDSTLYWTEGGSDAPRKGELPISRDTVVLLETDERTLHAVSEGVRLTIRFESVEQAAEWRDVLQAKVEDKRVAASLPPQPVLEYASSCYLPTTWLELTLIKKIDYNHNTTIYTFGLPENTSLRLPVCGKPVSLLPPRHESHLLPPARLNPLITELHSAPGCGRLPDGGKDDYDGSDAIRPYTPISDNSVLGSFDLMIKRYDGAAVSNWLYKLAVNARVSFKHIAFNVKVAYPFEGKKRFGMIAGGSGITPMYQALHKLLSTPGDDREGTLLYSNRTFDDILLKDELHAFAAHHKRRFRCVHLITRRPPDQQLFEDGLAPPVEISYGRIDAEKMQKYLPSPADDVLLFICGTPAMYYQLSGPRTEKSLPEGCVLQAMGYTAGMVAKM